MGYTWLEDFTWIDRTNWPEPITDQDVTNVFGPGRVVKLDLPATMDEHVQRRYGDDDDPEGRFK